MAGAPPFAFRGIDHVVLLVGDMAAARNFYENVLGCTLDRLVPAYGMAQLRAGAALIDLVDIGSEQGRWGRPEVPGGRNLDHFCLALNDCEPEAVRAHLASHGIAIVEEGVRYGAGGDGYSIYIRDPSNNQVELKCPLSRADR